MSHRPSPRRAAAGAALAISILAIACGGGRNAAADSARAAAAEPITVFAAGSLARPMRAALDTFAARTGTTYALESSGSLELARRLTDLGKTADVVALADEDVFPRLLMPAHVSWYARFARNRLVLAHGANAKGIADAERGEWRAVLLRPEVETGRADPDLDPAGYRTLMLFQLAERFHGEPGLARRLEAAIPRRNVRPKSAELVALLQSNELDYAWMYESWARGARLPFITVAPEIDLGEERLAGTYDAARVRVLGAEVGDTIEMRGIPIRYGLTIPVSAPHVARAGAFVRFLLSPDGRQVLRGEYLDALDAPVVVGEGRPAFLDAIAVVDTGAAMPAPGPGRR
ncbi:MAG: extracellular solute-binding protein [Gemmatimonadota bacterium]